MRNIAVCFVWVSNVITTIMIASIMVRYGVRTVWLVVDWFWLAVDWLCLVVDWLWLVVDWFTMLVVV